MELIRKIEVEKAEKKAKWLGAIYSETSAKTGHNVAEIFTRAG